jgi:hypothetical protein
MPFDPFAVAQATPSFTAFSSLNTEPFEPVYSGKTSKELDTNFKPSTL